MKYFKKIIGERIYLSPVNIGDAETYTKWLNDYDVSVHIGYHPRMLNLQNEKKYLEELSLDNHTYAIVLLDDNEMIGNIGFNNIEHRSRRAEVGLFIGEEKNRGKGYGTEALRLMLDYGFNTLNFHNIMLFVHSDNEQAIACYKKAGFREFGRRRESKFKNGRYIDIVHMDILDNEFKLEEQ